MTDAGRVVEWRIENFSQWCEDVHGKHISSPQNIIKSTYIQLYPKGITGHGEHLVVHLCSLNTSFSGELSFYSSTGSLLCSKQQVNEEFVQLTYNLELPPGPKFEDVLTRIRESKDFIILSCRIKDPVYPDMRMCTTINSLKISVKINPSWIEKMEPDATKDFFYIQLSPNDNLGRMWLKICSKNDILHFTISPPTEYELPFAVEMCLTESNDTVVSCAKKEHVFRDDTPWTFPDSLQKKESVEKGISLFLCLKTKDLIQSPINMSCAYSCVSIESKNKICFPGKAPTTDTVIPNKVAVLTNDSGSQTSLTSDMPDDSVLVLSKELMCLYQDQKFSDITLKCDNVTFPVHSAILSARSPVFDRLLSSDMKEAASSEVDIGDLDPSTLGLFLTYLYTGSVDEELQCDRAFKLYYAADKYQVPSLKKECSKFLCDNVSVSNVCDILSLADKHQDHMLTAVSNDFILNNFNEVLSSEEWDTLKGREPLLAVNTVTSFAQKNYLVKNKTV